MTAFAYLTRVFQRGTAVTATAMLIAACSQSTSLSSSQDYAAVDKYSGSAYSDVAKMLRKDSFVKQVEQGVAMKPADFANKFWGGGVDGDVKFAGQVYHNVLLNPKHSPYMARNIEFYAHNFGTMDKLFTYLRLGKGSTVSAADVKLYYRFTADVLQAGGFTKHANAVVAKYSSAQIFTVMRVGVFIALMPDGLGSQAAGLGLVSNGQTNNIAGMAAAGIQLTGGVGKLNLGLMLDKAPSSGKSPYLPRESSGLFSLDDIPTVPEGQAVVTNRIPGNGQPGMNPNDATQCYNMHGQSNDGRVSGLPTAGVDNTTFGSGNNGDVTSACGKCLKINNSAPILVADRIWENGGRRNLQPSNGQNAPKTGTSKGYTQYDLDPTTFRSLFPNPGNNPVISTATLDDCPSNYPKPGNSFDGGTSPNPPRGSGT